MKISAQDHLTGIMTHARSGLAKIFEAYTVHQSLAAQFARDMQNSPLPAMGEEITFVLYRSGTLAISVKTASMRLRLQYEKSSLIEHLRQKKTWIGLKDIKIQVSA